MDETRIGVARACLAAAERDAMTFPEIVRTLAAAGLEGYAVDFRRGVATYYDADGAGAVDLPMHRPDVPVGAAFDPAPLQAAICEAQRQVAGYTYRGFCEKAAAAGCAGYLVSFVGRRAVYFGRTGDTHVERFPD